MPVKASSRRIADDPRAGARRWVSVHLYYHDALDDLLRGAIGPLADELAAERLTDGFFFVRYWQGGQHLRLRVRLRDEVDAQPVEQLVEARLGEFFGRCPSQTLVSPENYVRSAGRLGRHEYGPRGIGIEPLRPNNSLRHVAYLPEEDRLGGPAGVAAFEPHFIDSSALTLELIAADPSGRRRTGRALAMMLLAAAVFLPGPRSLARFFRHSYRDWATRNASGDLARSARDEVQFEQRYERQRALLGGIAGQLLDPARPGAGTHLDEISARWMRSVTTLRDQLSTERLSVESGLFQCVHKHNNRLGITVTEETYLLFLSYRTLTEISGGNGSR